MLANKRDGAERCWDRPVGIGFLEQGFEKLPTDGKNKLKDFLQSLVSLQNTVAGAGTHAPQKDERGVVKVEIDTCPLGSKKGRIPKKNSRAGFKRRLGQGEEL